MTKSLLQWKPKLKSYHAPPSSLSDKIYLEEEMGYVHLSSFSTRETFPWKNLYIISLGTDLSHTLYITVSEIRNWGDIFISMYPNIVYHFVHDWKRSKGVLFIDTLKPHCQLLSYCHPLSDVVMSEESGILKTSI